MLPENRVLIKVLRVDKGYGMKSESIAVGSVTSTI